MDKQLISTYADLIIEKGINLQKGKNILILTGPGTYYFARELSKSAYRHGATYVQVLLDDLDVLSARLANQDEEQLAFSPAFLKSFDFEICAEGWSYIRIDATEERLDHDELDQKKNQIYGKAKRQFHETRGRHLMRNDIPWCVCCAPGPLWAKRVLGEQATVEDLMEVLKPILLLDTPDPCEAWEQKQVMLDRRRGYLNSLGVDALHFKSSKTDLTIGFTDQANFVGGGDEMSNGRHFFPNIPTEEIFTTPNRLRAEGYVTTTKPVNVLDMRTEEVRLVFKDGQVVDYSAKVGQQAMDAFFAVDEGTRRLGEVALVDETSPIARTNLVFNSILLDENASCHLALGDGYPSALLNGSTLSSDEQLHAAGCNTSLMHIDFMVGSKDMDIDAFTRDGRTVPVMRQGVFVF